MYAVSIALALTNSPGAAVPSYTFTVEGFLPTRLNILLRASWAKRYRLLKGDADRIGWAFRCSGIPRAAGPRRVSVCFSSPHTPSDPDGRLKGLFDGLRACGALVEDSPAYLEIGRIRSASGPRATVIELEDLEG